MRPFLLLISLLALLMMSQSAFSQIASSGIVGYDPLFWKRELRLSDEQCRQLRDINADFYKSLITAASYRAKHDLDRIEIIQLLNNRSGKIMNVFSYRQRRRWDKIADTYNSNIVASISSLKRSSWVKN